MSPPTPEQLAAQVAQLAAGQALADEVAALREVVEMEREWQAARRRHAEVSESWRTTSSAKRETALWLERGALAGEVMAIEARLLAATLPEAGK